MRWRASLVGAFFAVLTVGSIAGAQSSPLEGTWQTANKSHVQISKCATGHCGRLTKVSVPPKIYADYKSEIEKLGVENLPDYFNKDPALRSRRMQGLQILTLPNQTGPGLFEGEVYNAEDGETYYGKMEVITEDHLRLSGCVFFNLLCRSEEWERVR